MIVSSNAVLGCSPEAYALTLTQQEILDLRDALSRSLATVSLSERVSASRRAEGADRLSFGIMGGPEPVGRPEVVGEKLLL